MNEEAAATLAELQTKSEKLGKWDALNQSELGKFLKQEIHEKLSAIRKAYRHVRADLPTASVVLSGLQGEEKMLSELLDSLSNSHYLKKGLDKEVEIVSTLALKGETEPAPSGQSIAPRGMNERSND